MATAKLVPSYERFLDRVIETMMPEEILAFKVPEEEQRRVEDLLERNNEGELTPQEAAELQQIAQFDELMMLLKIRAILNHDLPLNL